MTYLATTVIGIEDVAEKELKGETVAPGRVRFSKLIDNAKSAHRVIELLDDFTFSNFDELRDKAGRIKFDFKGTFKIQCKREGEHGFRSPDVGKAVGASLQSKGFASSFKDPKNVVVIDIVQDRCFVGMLVKENFCRRDYRVRFNNQSIHSCVAYALVKLSGVKKSETLLDPFCKDGVIAIEAYFSGVKKVEAFDANKNNVRNANINAAMAKAPLKFKQYDLSWANTLFKEKSVDYVVTNLFLSNRDRDAGQKASDLFEQVNYVVKKGLTLITNKPDLVKSRVKHFKLDSERIIGVGGMNYTVMKYKHS